MQTAGYVFDQVRSLVDDQEQNFATDDYLRTFLQMAQDDLQMVCMRDPNIGQIKAAVTLPNVPAGTQSLAQELLPPVNGKGGHLSLLSDPIEIREKMAGDQEINYCRMIPRGVPVQISTQNSRNLYYTFTGNDLILPGANQNLDLWVWGSFKPAPIKDKNSPLITDTETILKYSTAKLVARSRGMSDVAKDNAGDQAVVQSAWMRDLYKIQQSIRVVNRPWRPKTTFWFDSAAAY